MPRFSLPLFLLIIAVVGCASAESGPATPIASAHPPREHTPPVSADDAPVAPPATTRPNATRPAAAVEPAVLVEPAVPADPVDALLDRLEASAAGLEGFSAKIDYEVYDDLLARREIRRGELIYRVDPANGTKRFAILFDTIIRNNRRERRSKHYIFDGQWLAEIDHRSRQFIKRQIVPPGKSLDPLKLGEGPFPLPVGQPKAQVLARFDVSAFTAPADGPLKKVLAEYPNQVDGLLLIPKPGTPEAKDFTRLELLYDRATLLPVGINLLEINGDRKTVRLSDAQRNEAFTGEQLERLEFADPDPREWAVSVQPWQGGP